MKIQLSPIQTLGSLERIKQAKRSIPEEKMLETRETALIPWDNNG